VIRSLSSTALAAVVLLAVTAGSAQAQGPSYVPSPPTRGALYADGQTGRYLLGGQWLFRADPGNGGLAQGWWRDVSAADGWSPLSVPNSYNAGDFTGASMNGYVGWYRRDFTLPSGAFAGFVTAASRRWIVRFESVNYRATVWLNGRQIGVHAGAFLPFELDLKGLRPGVNRLIVRVDDRRSGADLPPGPGGGWWNFGGILREVYLRTVQRVDISALQVRPLLRCLACAATVTEQATLRNVSPATQTVTLRGSYGGARVAFSTIRIPRGATRVVTATARIVHPRLWSPDRPFLYRAKLILSDSHAQPLGGWVTDSGIRTISVRNGRLRLNGRLLRLRGVNVHEQDLIAGGVLDRAHTSRLISWVRRIGASLIRAHYPLSPELQELADRTGLLIWSEIPVYQVKSQYLTQPGWMAHAHALLRSNIIDNQNHPSVLLWSVGNELTTPATSAEAAYIAGASKLAHQLDPTRPVGMAVGSWPGVACQTAYAPLDVIGFNDYFGWFDAGGGTTDDRDALSPFLDFFHGCYPSKAIFVSEFGFEGNRAGPVEERGTYAFQSNAIAFHLGVFATKSWLAGAIYFPLQDFAARPGWGGGNPLPDPPFVEKGMFDVQGNPKPAYSVLSEIYHRTSQIGPRSLAAGDQGRRRRGG
jgi:beta-glucuronidase